MTVAAETIDRLLGSHCVSPREKQFMAAVLDLARWMGWRTYHPWDSRRSASGWPDLTLVRDERLLFAELKTERGRLSGAQQEWIDALRRAGCDVRVWRPMDWPEIEQTLQRIPVEALG